MYHLKLPHVPQKGYKETRLLVINSLFECLRYYVEEEHLSEASYAVHINQLRECDNKFCGCHHEYRVESLFMGLYRWWNKFGSKLWYDEGFKFPEDFPRGDPDHWENLSYRHARAIAKYMNCLWT